MFHVHIGMNGPGSDEDGSMSAIIGAGLIVFAVLVVMIGLAIFLATHVRADDEHSHNGPVGEFYKNWKQPPVRWTSCCNNEDCYATPIRYDKEDGNYYALRREDQRWLLIRPGVLEQQQEKEDNILNAPDGRSHACMQKPEHGDQVYCATLGSEM